MMDNDLFFSASVILVSFVLALILTGWVHLLLLRRAVLDIPNARSSHHLPVPRGGGWALLMVLMPALAGASYVIDHDWVHAPLVIAIGLLATISWLDDQRGMSAGKRLAIHVLAACIGSLCFAPEQTLFGGHIPFLLDRAAMIVGWVWFINLYNFMDGIDGITGVETISIATGLCLVMTFVDVVDPYLSFMTLILTGTCLGFLVYNWHPARLFMGDIGSVPLGYIVGFGLITLAVKGHLVAAMILPLYYLADSGITIAKRALRREKIWQAHRQHFYQQAALGTGRHDTVVLWVVMANAGLIVAAIASLLWPFESGGAALVIVAVLLQKMHKISEQRDVAL